MRRLGDLAVKAYAVYSIVGDVGTVLFAGYWIVRHFFCH